jgi:hypothetical protein
MASALDISGGFSSKDIIELLARERCGNAILVQCVSSVSCRSVVVLLVVVPEERFAGHREVEVLTDTAAISAPASALLNF